MLLSLFCYVRGESHKNVFLVKIEDGDTVDGLRKAIKTEKSPSFNDIDASSLLLWKVSLPYSQNIKEDVERHLVGKKPLDPVDDISDLFPLPLEKRTVYVVIDRPAVGTQQDLSGENPAEKGTFPNFNYSHVY